MKKILILLVLSIFILAGCSQNANTPEPSNTNETSNSESQDDVITLVLDWTPNTNHTGIFVAKEKGFFKEEGLNVEIVQPPDDGAETLVASNRAEFGISFQDTIAAAWAKDSPLPVTAVGAVINHNTSGIISLQDKGINSFKNLEGHNYATWENPIEMAMIEYLVESEDGDFSQVELIPSTVTNVISALQTNVDSIWVYYAWDGVATELEGLQTKFLDFAASNPVFDYYSPIVIANNEFLENNPDKAEKFMSALSKGYNYAIENAEEAADILLKEAPELDKELVYESQLWINDEYIRDGEYWGYIDKNRWDAFYTWLWENELIEKEIPAGFGFTNEYLPQ